MKRIMALAICICIISCLFAPIVSAVDERKPLDVTIDFENGVACSNMNYAMGNIGIYDQDVDGFSNDNVYSGNVSFYIAHNSSSGNLNMRFRDFSFKEGITYNISFEYKTTGSAWFYFVNPNTKSTTLNSSEWNRYEFNLTFSSDVDYFEIGTTIANITTYIDDLVIKETHTIDTASSDTDLGTVSATATESKGIEAVTLNAYPQYGVEFSGWNDKSGNTVSTESSYTLSNIIEDISLTAVFSQRETGIQAEYFEAIPSYTTQGNGTATFLNNTGDSVYMGKGALKLFHNAAAGNFTVKISGLTLKRYCEYEVSFYYKTDKPVWVYIDSADNGKTLCADEWTKYSVRINTNLTKSGLTIGTTTPSSQLLIDNLEIKECYRTEAINNDNKMGEVSVNYNSAAYGDEIVYTSDAFYGYELSAWKNEYGIIVSNEPAYSVIALAPIKLTAYFEQKKSENTEITFEDYVNYRNMDYSSGSAEITASDFYEGAKALRLTSTDKSGNLKIQLDDIALKGGHRYNISFWYKSAISGWAYLYNNTNNSMGISLSVSEEWQHITKTVNCESDVAYLEIGTVAPNNILIIDNIEVKEIYNVSVASSNNKYGTASVSAGSFSFGDMVTLSAAANDNYAFVGYYYKNDRLLSNMSNFSFLASGDIAVTAVFERRCNENVHKFYVTELNEIKKGYVCEDCGFSYTINDINDDGNIDICDLVRQKKALCEPTTAYNKFGADCNEDGMLDSVDMASLKKVLLGLTDYTFDAPSLQKRSYDSSFSGEDYIAENHNSFVYRGSGSLYIDGTKSNDSTVYYKLSTMFVKPYTTYALSAWVYGVSCTSNVQLNILDYNEFAYISGNTATYSGEWKELCIEFTTGNIEANQITPILVINSGNKFYFDELSLAEKEYEGTYSEKLYNIIPGGDFEDEAFEINEAENALICDSEHATSGQNALQINNGTVLERQYTLEKAGKYRFAYSYFAENSNSFSVIITTDSGTYSLSPTQISKPSREYFEFANYTEGYSINIKIITTDSVIFDDLYLFKEKYSQAENPNVYGKTAVEPIIRTALLASSTAQNISINYNGCVQNDYLGNTGVYYAYNYIPEKYDRTYTEEMQQIELERLSQAGVSVVRTQYSPCWAWNTSTNGWDWNTAEMQGFYSYLEAMKKLGIDVAIQIGWKTSEISSERLTSYSYNPFYILANGNSELIDGFYAAWVANSVSILHNMGYSNVKYLVAFTEPSYGLTTEDYTEDIEFWKHYVMLAHNALESYGIRDSVDILGFNMGAYNRSTSPVDDYLALKYMANDSELLSAIDIFTYHIYVTTANDADNYSEWYNYMSECVRIASSVGKQLWFDEGEWNSSDNTDWETRSSYGACGTQLALKTVAAMNSGLQTAMRWTLVDQYWTNQIDTSTGKEWLNGCHKDGLLPNMLETSIPRMAYYAYALIGKYTNGMSNVYAGSCDDGLYVTACTDNKGNLTIIVVNMGTQNTDFTLSGLMDFSVTSLNRHTYNPSELIVDCNAEIIAADTIINEIENSFTDNLSAGSFCVYTTIK